MHSHSAGDLHTEVLMIDRAALDPSPPFFSSRKNSVSMQSCQHHEWCYKPEGTKAIKAAVWNTYICNAITCFMAGGGGDAGLAGSLYEVTSLPVTQPRAIISFKLNNKLKEEDGKKYNEGRKSKKIQNQILNFMIFCQLLVVFRQFAMYEHNSLFLHH